PQQQNNNKKLKFELSDEARTAFYQLKNILTADLVLGLPDDTLPFKLQTDASVDGIGAVLLQMTPNGDRPLAYICERWRLKLAEYRFNVKHIQGKKNNVADYLSRSPVETAEEDIEERTQSESTSTQTDLSFSSLNDNLIPLKITTAITRAQAKLQQAMATPSIKPPGGKINELIPQGKAATDEELIIKPL
ncbi:unnamed protein product, partial [Rotaria sp. Silwood2]